MGPVRQTPQFSYEPGPYEFRPPRNNRLATWLARMFAPRFLNSVGISEVSVSERDLAKMQAYLDSRLVLVSNHPAWEPVVLFHTAALAGKEVNIMTAHELFARSWLHGFVLPLIGAYSVNRGTSDMASFRETRRLIAEGKRWLVLFPEGQDHYMSDLLMPFQSGLVRLAFWALDEMKHQGPPPVRLIPVAVRYHFTRDMTAAIDQSLTRLESALNLYAASGMDRYERLLRISQRLIEDNEGYYRIPSDVNRPLPERIDRLRNVIIERVAAGIGIAPPDESRPLRDRVRTLLNALDLVRPPDAGQRNAYEQQLIARGEDYAKELHSELYRVLTFVGVSGNYIAQRPTAERFCDVLSRLEYEVSGSAPKFGPKRAVVVAGQPIDLAGRYQDYLTDKRGVPEQVTAELEAAVRNLLEETAGLMNPIESGLAAGGGESF